MFKQEKCWWVFVFMGLWSASTWAIEEAEYETLVLDEPFEIRKYAPHIVAQTQVEEGFEGAGSAAFSRLFEYISGNNEGQQDIAMTRPVAQESRGLEIDMTAPVSQVGQKTEAGQKGLWTVSFMMPASFSFETTPHPKDPQVSIIQVPGRYMAAIRYSGFWSRENFDAHLNELEEWMQERKLVATGEPVWARYNPPLMPWFLRRNEILIPIEAPR